MSVITAEREITDHEQLSFDEDLELEAEIKPYYWVNQSNDLINTQQDLTLTERRIIFSLVSLVQPEDKDFKTYVIQIKELANLIGISETGFYERVEKAVDGLQQKVFIVESKNNKGNDVLDKINWVQQATYIKGEGLIRIRLSDSLANYLMNLEKFTKYRLYNVLKLKSEYAWRMYEILKEREPWSKRIIKVKELRKLLNIPDDKLTLMKNFRSVVLDQAQKEINEKTDIAFDYEVYKKKGRSIDSFVFYIRKNTTNVDYYISEEVADYDIQRLYNRLILNGVNKKTSIKFIKSYHPHYIEENLRYVMKYNNDDNEGVDNLAAYIVKAIENNYADSPYDSESNDNSMYRLMIGNFENRLKEVTQKQIQKLEEISDYYNTVLIKERDVTTERISEISRERQQRIHKKINEFQKDRDSHRYPPLTIDDFYGSKVRHFFVEWLGNQINTY